MLRTSLLVMEGKNQFELLYTKPESWCACYKRERKLQSQLTTKFIQNYQLGKQIYLFTVDSASWRKQSDIAIAPMMPSPSRPT